MNREKQGKCFPWPTKLTGAIEMQMKQEELIMLKENLELLANGQDPKTGYYVDDTILKSSFNKCVLRNAASIIDLLLKLGFNSTYSDKRKKLNFYISPEKLEKIEISKKPIPISVFTYKINEHIDDSKMKKLKASQITAWLMNEGYLDEIENEDGKKFKVLTEKSSSIGISAQERTSEYGNNYKVNLYSEDGQRFIIANLDNILSFH